MKAKVFFVLIVAVIFSLFSCNSGSKKDNQKSAKADSSKESLDWKGVYTGTVPCADCMGIFVKVNLKNDTYTMTVKYLGKEDASFESTGNFKWNDIGDIITLEADEAGMNKFKVAENKIIMLDMEGNDITGQFSDMYVLGKINEELVEKYWKLEELNGNKIVLDEKMSKEPHIILRIDENRVNGNGGCNNLMGSYEIKDDNKIAFSRMASTMKACPDMQIENEFTKTLEKVNTYKVEKEHLTLYDSQNNPLATFKVVYL